MDGCDGVSGGGGVKPGGGELGGGDEAWESGVVDAGRAGTGGA